MSSWLWTCITDHSTAAPIFIDVSQQPSQTIWVSSHDIRHKAILSDTVQDAWFEIHWAMILAKRHAMTELHIRPEYHHLLIRNFNTASTRSYTGRYMYIHKNLYICSWQTHSSRLPQASTETCCRLRAFMLIRSPHWQYSSGISGETFASRPPTSQLSPLETTPMWGQRRDAEIEPSSSFVARSGTLYTQLYTYACVYCV